MLSFLRHVPFAPTPTGANVDVLSVEGSPGEVLSCSFSVCSTQQVENIQIDCTALTSFANAIPGELIEVYIVKVWTLSGLGVYQGPRCENGELLLKDDTVNLTDGYIREYVEWRDLVKPSYRYVPPKIRTSGPVQTRLEPGQSKQIWISIKLPEELVAGHYSGEVVITTSSSCTRLPIFVEVLPFRLMSPRQDLMLWYRGTLDQSNSQHAVDETTLRMQLQDIFDHGFCSVTISEEDTDSAQKVIDIAESVGFDRHIMFTPPYPRQFERLHFTKSTPLFYLSDEIDAQSGEKREKAIRRHHENQQLAISMGVQTMCSLLDFNFAEQLIKTSDIGQAPTILSYYLPSNRRYFAVNSQFAPATSSKAYLYWMAHLEKPNVHRVLAGVYLWKSKAAGISPYCYQHLPVYPFSPFNDFDPWEPEFQLGQETGTFRQHLAVYPCRSGTIPTLQWEGIRQGILDLKYLYTLHCLLESLTSLGHCLEEVAAIQASVNQFLCRINLSAVSINSPDCAEPFENLEAQDYWQFRRDLIQYIKQARTLVDTVEKRHAGTR